MFLCAKTASAAPAALGFAGYLLRLLGDGEAAMPWIAFGAVVLFTFLAFWVPITIWAVGLGHILIGLVWKNLAPRLLGSKE